MSHQSAKIRSLDGNLIGWIEYSATVDTARAQIFATADELADHWRGPQPDPCACAGVAVTLDLRTDAEDVAYAAAHPNLWHWPARACLEHRCLVAGRTPPE